MNLMHRLMAGGLLAAAAIGYLAYLGGTSSWQYYLSVDEAIAHKNDLSGKRVRVSGRIVAGSLTIGEDRRNATYRRVQFVDFAFHAVNVARAVGL